MAVFVQALEGTAVAVELRLDALVRGTLLAADERLNLQLTGVSYTPLQGPPRRMDYLYVRGAQVRYIHLPGSLDPAAAVEAHRRRVAAAVRAHAAEQQTAQQRAGRTGKGEEAVEDGKGGAQT